MKTIIKVSYEVINGDTKEILDKDNAQLEMFGNKIGIPGFPVTIDSTSKNGQRWKFEFLD